MLTEVEASVRGPVGHAVQAPSAPEHPTKGPSYLTVFLAELRCAVVTLALLIGGRIKLPANRVGRTIRFADGSSSLVYRETSMRDRRTAPHVMLAVKFRLRLLGSSSIGHALFRFESLFNTLLFAGYQGFTSKLWLTDRNTDVYRGIYEWEDGPSARRYVDRLMVVLAPWTEPGSLDYRIVEADRASFLDGSYTAMAHAISTGEQWWLPVAKTRVLATVATD